MKDKKLQIFVSSTYTDLKEERQAAVEAILSSGHIPAGMELFAAGDESQMNVIKRWIDESDVYLLILGGRYGSLEKQTNKSYTNLEYEYALNLKKPLFSIVINPEALEKKVKQIGSSVLEQQNPKEYKEFKDQVLTNLVKFWDDKKDIKIAIHETLSEFSYRKELIGWIRGDNAINTGELAEQIARLTKENSELREALSIRGEGNKNSLYFNMTFEELSKLLDSEKIIEQGIEITLLKYLISNGHMFTKRAFVTNLEAFNKLRNYKIIYQDLTYSNVKRFLFTEDGHNFYLKLLLKNKN